MAKNIFYFMKYNKKHLCEVYGMAIILYVTNNIQINNINNDQSKSKEVLLK